MKIETAVVPIAGWGTRLMPLTLLTAKEFLPLGSKPAIQHVVEELAVAGVTKIIFVASERKRSVTDLFDRNNAQLEKLTGNKINLREHVWAFSAQTEITFETVIQKEQLGMGHAVLCARSHVPDQPFIVALGDCVIGLPGQPNVLSSLIRHYETHESELAISFLKVPEDQTQRYGIADPSSQEECFELRDLVEKPLPENAPSNLAVCGRYILPPAIFDCLENSPRGVDDEIQLTDAIRQLIRNGRKAMGLMLPENVKRYDVGDMNSYIRSFVEFALSNPSHRQVAENAFEEFYRERN